MSNMIVRTFLLGPLTKRRDITNGQQQQRENPACVFVRSVHVLLLPFGAFRFHPFIDSPAMTLIFEVTMVLTKLIRFVPAVKPSAEHIFSTTMLVFLYTH